MLKYSFSNLQFNNDIIRIDINGLTMSDYGYSNGNTMTVTFLCKDTPIVKSGEYLRVNTNIPYYNDVLEKFDYVSESRFYQILSVDNYSNTITIIAPKYQQLESTNCYIKYDENNNEYWYFDIDKTHMYQPNEQCVFYFAYTDSDYLYINNAEYVDCETFRWKYDDNVENADNCKKVLFPDWSDNSQFGTDTSNRPNILSRRIKITRPQYKWSNAIPQENSIDVYCSLYNVSINVPINLTYDVRLHSEENIREYYIDNEKENAINRVTDMEKVCYEPAIKLKNPALYFPVTKINFNLHFREHSGDNWTVENSDTWNFDKYGYNSIDDNYYSYNIKDNQSDLLSYAGFNTTDVKYQKNVLKKSFLRLMFYDSMNPTKQGLLGYSTIFFNTGKLYSKCIKNFNLNAYCFNNDNVIGIRSDREVDSLRLSAILDRNVTDDEIEDYRLSCRFSVEHPYLSNNSSEGFNLYLWADNDVTAVPESIYMKVDFNHAGYGRTIPFMAPYWDTTIDKNPDGTPHLPGFKTNNEIIKDWENGGYGIQKYMRYSYIRFNYVFDKENNKHVYYLSTDHYGEIYGNELNINLYEARVAYE